MAYVVGDYKVVVRGNLCDGEIFTNTWSFHDETGGQDIQEAVDLLSDLYEDWYGFASWISDETSVVGAVAYDLFNDTFDEMTWGVSTGASASECLPTQLAMRISLTGANSNVNGGPFIGGFSINATEGGLIHTSCRSDFITAIETFTGALDTAGWNLAIDRPTVPSLSGVGVGRVGRRWDVIRKRSSAIAESYATFDLL